MKVELLEDRTVPAKLDVVITAASVYATEAGFNTATDLTLPLDPGNEHAFNELDVRAKSSGNGHVDSSATASIVGDRFAGVSIGAAISVKLAQVGYGTGEHPYMPLQLDGEAAATVRVRVTPDDPSEVGNPIVLNVRAFTDLGNVGYHGHSSETAFYSGANQSENFFSNSLRNQPAPDNIFRDLATTVGAEFQFQTHLVMDSKSVFPVSTNHPPGTLVQFAGGVRNFVSLIFELRQPDFVAIPNNDPKAPDKFLWNTVEEGGGFKFTYDVTPAADGSVPDTVIDFYWATGPRYEDRIPDAKAFEYRIDTPQKKTTGRHDHEKINVPHLELTKGHRSPPSVTDPATGKVGRATYLVMAIDPAKPGDAGLVPELNEANNVTALKVVPLVVNVVTHGFAPPDAVGTYQLPAAPAADLPFPTFIESLVNLLGTLPQSDRAWAAFRERFVNIARTLEALPERDSILDGRVASYVTAWDSSTGFTQAFIYRMLSLLAQAAANGNRAFVNGIRPGEVLASPLTLGGTYALSLYNAAQEERYVQLWQQRVREFQVPSAALAIDTANRVAAVLTGGAGLLGDLSPVESTRLQRVQYVGHSRGAAVNAGVSTLLLNNGYRNGVYYAALDGFAADFADALPLFDGEGLMFSDIAVSSAQVARVPGALKVNYQVEEGLEVEVLRILDKLIEKSPIPGTTAVVDAFILDPRTRDAVRNGIELRAQVKPSTAWENAVLRWPNHPATNHLNAVDTYLDSKGNATPDAYITDNYLGWHRKDGLDVDPAPGPGRFRRDFVPASRTVPQLPRAGLVADAGGGLYRLDPAGGPPTRLGTLPFTPFDLAVGPDGTAYALAYESGTSVLFRLAVDSGGVTATRVGPLGAFVNALEFRGDGTLLAAGQGVLYRVEPATGAAAEVSRSPVPVLSAGDLAFGPGGEVYLTSDTDGGQLVRVSANLDTWTVVGPTGVPGLGGLQFDGGTLFGYGPQGTVYRIDKRSGEALPAGSLGGVGTAIGAGAPAGRSPTRLGYRQFAVGADAGGPPTVRFFNADGAERAAGAAFDPSFTGGVRVASADFSGDGVADLVVGTGPGVSASVRVLDGATLRELFSVQPFEAAFTGGVYVAAGDLDGDGVPDLIVTPDKGGGPRVRVFGGRDYSQIADFFGIDDLAFRGGARASVGDLTGDGVGDLVVAAGFGGGPRVAVFDGTSLAGGAYTRKPFPDFFAFETGLRNGVYVAAGDLDGDGRGELVAGSGPGGGPRVSAFSGSDLLVGKQTRVADFFAGDVASRGGVGVAVKDLDGDGRADLVVGAGAGSRVTAYAGKSVGAGGTPDELFAFEALPGFGGGVYVG